jgi:hypothetical protein
VKVVLASFKKGKGLGANGMFMELYLGFMDILKQDMVQVIEESRTARKMLGTLNPTFIALIPKKQDVVSFDYFRPISLCTLIYKIISKIIANKLKSILSSN